VGELGRMRGLRYGRKRWCIPAYDSQIVRFLTASAPDLWWVIMRATVSPPRPAHASSHHPCHVHRPRTQPIADHPLFRSRDSYVLDRTLGNRRCHWSRQWRLYIDHLRCRTNPRGLPYWRFNRGERCLPHRYEVQHSGKRWLV
jgi:hypothetical protein